MRFEKKETKSFTARLLEGNLFRWVDFTRCAVELTNYTAIIPQYFQN